MNETEIIDAGTAPETEAGECVEQIRARRPDARPMDEQMNYLYDTQRTAEADATGDGTDIESGAWAEICRAVLDVAPGWITPAARAEYLRCNGLTDRRV